jgi:hypothetical protein
MAAQRHPRVNPEKSYHIPLLRAVLLCHRAEAPGNLILSHADTSFIVAPHGHQQHLEYST